MGIKLREENLRQHQQTTYGRLKPLRYWGTDLFGAMKLLCKCSCGNTPVILASSLVNKFTKSCGCLARGEDSYIYFVDNESHANSDCYFYLANIDNKFYKPGISSDPKLRAYGGKYDSYLFISPKLTRCEAWTIEQIILRETLSASTEASRERKEGADGGEFEYRTIDFFKYSFYINRFNELIEEMAMKGWEEMYLSKF